MEDPVTCRARLCKLCHADFKLHLEEKARVSPSYAKPTLAATRRNIAIRLSTPKKKSASEVKPESRISFLDLPTEVRLQIYRACLEDCVLPYGFPIAGWVKGGAIHPDAGSRMYTSNMWIYAAEVFPRRLFLLNKRVYSEAVREVYKYISPRFVMDELRLQLPQLRYWLQEHPMRYVRDLEIPLVMQLEHHTLVRWGPAYSRKPATNNELQQLSHILSRMPNLRRLKVQVTVDPHYGDFIDRGNSRYALSVAGKNVTWKKQLATIISRLPQTCESTLVFLMANYRSRDQVEALRFEAGFAELAKSMTGFEDIRQFDGKIDFPRPSTRSGFLLYKLALKQQG